MVQQFTRRTWLANATAGLLLSPALSAILAAEEKSRRTFKIGVCDWSIGRCQDIAAFDVAEQIGLDGVQVSFDGGPKFDLRQAAVRRQYQAAAERHRLEICALAMGVLNAVPFASDPRAARWVEESIDVMQKMNVRIILLAFFGRGEIKGDAALQANVIRNLKKIAPAAEKAGVTFGLETSLNADEHLRILDAIGSPSVKVYYDVSNSLRRGCDIYREIPRLGDRICQFHMKEKDDRLLGQGIVDFRRVRDAIFATDYRGWLVIEGATTKGRSTVDCHRANLAYLRTLFPAG
jgi:L-ribulose-5-phosphate 3-epimerase